MEIKLIQDKSKTITTLSTHLRLRSSCTHMKYRLFEKDTIVISEIALSILPHSVQILRYCMRLSDQKEGDMCCQGENIEYNNTLNKDYYLPLTIPLNVSKLSLS